MELYRTRARAQQEQEVRKFCMIDIRIQRIIMFHLCSDFCFKTPHRYILYMFRLEYADVFHKVSLKIWLNYLYLLAYLRILTVAMGNLDPLIHKV